MICIYVIDDSAGYLNTSLGCRPVTTTAQRPIGAWDFTSFVTGDSVDLAGWAFDPVAPGQVLDVVVRVEHGFFGAEDLYPLTADDDRPDVAAVFPAAGPAHGFATSVVLPRGQGQVCVDIIGLHETREMQCPACNLP